MTGRPLKDQTLAIRNQNWEGNRGVEVGKTFVTFFFCHEGEKRKKEKKTQRADIQVWSWFSLDLQWSGLPTSAGFFLAARKGKFPLVTDKTNGFGASLGLQRL